MITFLNIYNIIVINVLCIMKVRQNELISQELCQFQQNDKMNSTFIVYFEFARYH